jgi:CheY-like chemotaxis protein
MSILIVEDNPVNAKLLRHNLTAGGYDTHWAANGRQALEFLKNHSGIRLVISDIMMPEMDGLEFLGFIKEHAQWKHLPVIMCTSLSDLETVKKALEEGCRSYLVKPIDTGQLMQKVHEAIGYERAILKDRVTVMDELGLRKKDYEGILSAFTTLVDSTIAMLDQSSGNIATAPLTIDLQNLSERADLLGAEKVSAILNALSDTTRATATKVRNALYSQLLAELKQLKHTLTPARR